MWGSDGHLRDHYPRLSWLICSVIVVVVVIFVDRSRYEMINGASVVKRAHIGLKPGFPPFCFGAGQTTIY